jgi:hypothetical protein
VVAASALDAPSIIPSPCPGKTYVQICEESREELNRSFGCGNQTKPCDVGRNLLTLGG